MLFYVPMLPYAACMACAIRHYALYGMCPYTSPHRRQKVSRGSGAAAC